MIITSWLPMEAERPRMHHTRIASKALVLSLSLSAAAPALAQAPKAIDVELVPHRAVYDLILDQATAGSNVSDIRGRLVFDFAGSECKGYELNTRLVTAIVDREGKASMTDIRSESWEQAKGERFRFDTSQFVNNELSEATKGDARRSSDNSSISITLQKPSKAKLSLPGRVMFPTQHSLAILNAAAEGKRRLNADLYDGSEKGNKIYSTSAFIGEALPAGENSKLPPLKNGETLNSLVSWPVLISYYDKSQNNEGIPVYEISFRLYSNGVSRKLRLDYGNFSMSGEISQIEFKKPAPCPKSRGKSS